MMSGETNLFSIAAVETSAADEGRRVRERRISLHKIVTVLVAADCFVFVTLGLLPLALPLIRDGHPLGSMIERDETVAVGLGLLLFLAAQQILGGYRTRTLMRGGWSVRRVVMATFATFSLLIMLAAAAKITGIHSRVWFFTWMGSTLVLLPLVHVMIAGRVRRSLMQGAYVYRALSVGVRCAPMKQSEVTRVTHGLSRPLAPLRLARVEDLVVLEEAVREHELDEVYISVPWELAPEVFRDVRRLDHLAARIYVLPADRAIAETLLGARMQGESLQLQIQDMPIDGWGRVQKRAFDLLVAGGALLLLLPLMLLVALAIKLESRGPVFFRQLRQGFNGGTFEVLKFRSMRHELRDLGAERQTSRGDRRVTLVGRFIRRTSLDELPQLINVLRGDMSIVGPRPHALQTTAEGKALDEAVSDYAARHRVLPGITGLAQVNGLRGELDAIEKLKERVRHDIEYIETWSLLLDVKILLKTMVLVLYDPRAY